VTDQASGLRRLLAGSTVRTVCVAGAPSGCGRTTVAVNLAVALARQGARVLLVDCCTGGQRAAHLLGATPGVDLLDAMQVAGGGRAALVRCRTGLNLLQADRTLRSLRRAPDQIASWLSQVLDSVRESADMLVIDGPAEALAPAAAARDLILVTGPDAQSLTHSYRTLKRLAAQTARRRAFVLVNRAPSAAHASRIFGNLARTASEFLGMTLDELGWLPDDECIREAAAAGQPVLDLFPHAPVGRVLRDCARNVHGWRSSMESTLEPFAQRLVNAARLAAQYA
jgi:flagellar biosynthesis protein FlhG